MRRWVPIVVSLAACRGHFDAEHDAPAPGGPDALGACIAQVSLGGNTAFVLRGDGTIAAWGRNSFGASGIGSFSPAMIDAPTQVLTAPGGGAFDHVIAISGGVEQTPCALRDDGTAWCWGLNTWGQVGNAATGSGTQTGVPSPAQVVGGGGAALAGVAEVVAGEESTCARKTDGTVWCWGWNMYGQLGGSGLSASTAPVEVFARGGTAVLAAGVMVSYGHACAWDATGQLSCWGWNSAGQLGIGSTTDQAFAQPVALTGVVAAISAYLFTCALLGDGSVYCFGDNTYGQLGDGNIGAAAGELTPVPVTVAPAGAGLGSVAEIGAGDAHACARKTDGTVWCWGSNMVGQLGTGELVPAEAPSPVQVQLPGAALALRVGNNFACAVLAGDALWCWGDNAYGELAIGTFDTPSDLPARTMSACP
ncbi:MAG TPA: hypothetical protein VGF94_08805 [Kofleriaceae bacterium]